MYGRAGVRKLSKLQLHDHSTPFFQPSTFSFMRIQYESTSTVSTLSSEVKSGRCYGRCSILVETATSAETIPIRLAPEKGHLQTAVSRLGKHGHSIAGSEAEVNSCKPPESISGRNTISNMFFVSSNGGQTQQLPFTTALAEIGRSRQYLLVRCPEAHHALMGRPRVSIDCVLLMPTPT